MRISVFNFVGVAKPQTFRKRKKKKKKQVMGVIQQVKHLNENKVFQSSSGVIKPWNGFVT